MTYLEMINELEAFLKSEGISDKQISDASLFSIKIMAAKKVLSDTIKGTIEDWLNPECSPIDGIPVSAYFTGEQIEVFRAVLEQWEEEIMYIPLHVASAGSNGVLVSPDYASDLCFALWQYCQNCGENEPYEEFEATFFQYTSKELCFGGK